MNYIFYIYFKMRDGFIQKCITIGLDQEEFLKEEKNFKLSKFVQSKLDEYIKARREYKQFMEEAE